MAEPRHDTPRAAEGVDVFAGDGEMSRLMRAHDWSAGPLGPPSSWPRSLKIVVRILLDSRYAMWLGWGPDFTFFYNDAYARMTLGGKHPWALGRSAREVRAEIWGDIGPRAESVVRTGKATWDERLLLFLERRGFTEETYHTFSYSPVPDDDGGVGGMLCVVTEDTERAIGERRLKTLRELGARTTEEAKSAEEACRTAARTLAENPHDLPFVLVYLLDADARTARLAGTAGLPAEEKDEGGRMKDESEAEGSRAAFSWLRSSFILPIRPALHRPVRTAGRGHHLAAAEGAGFGPGLPRLGPSPGARAWPGGAWTEPTRQAVVLPMMKAGQARLAGFVVAGVSSRLVFNDEYRGFLELLAGHIGAAVANARAYEEERKRAEALAELDRAKTAFFSNVSHEFRTPLTLMLGPVEDLLARSYTDLAPAAKGQLEVVNRNGLRLLRLVNTLLDFSRIEAGRVRAVYQPTDLASFTADLAGVFRSACERAGLRVVDCPALSEPVYVDRDMWEKVVLNLLSNAFKFTFEGEISVSLRREGNAAELRVRDTGTGIPAEEMPRLFERFHRIENARGRTHEGSGIGLALVQELVKQHGGSITATSFAGQGTTFVVSIPLGVDHLPGDQISSTRPLTSTATGAGPFVEEALRWLPSEEKDEGSQEAAEGATSASDSSFLLPPSSFRDRPAQQDQPDDRPRVLVADDNADMRQYVRRLLAEHYRVEAVPDGQAALAAARERPPDLILSDVMMPRLDGFGLLRELRADPLTQSLPVILLSARAGEESRVEGLQAGADDYLVKPFGARELQARVSAHLQMARLRREAGEAVQKERDWLRVTLASIGDAVITTDTEGRVTFLNGVAEALTGWATADAAGRPLESVFRLVHEETRQPVENPAARALREGGVVGLANQAVLLGNDGSERPIDDSAAPVRDAHGRIIGCVLVFRDITARRGAEKALCQSEAHFRSMADNAPTMLWVTDASSSCTYRSKQWSEYTGRPADQDLGFGWLEALHPDDRPRARDAFLQAAGQRAAFGFDCRLPLGGQRRPAPVR
jgi:PAS domain S-box-containing protein